MNRFLLVLLLVACWTGTSHAAAHVRSMDPVIGPAFAEGLVTSPVIRRLVEILDASDVIVYLARGDCPGPAVACLMITRSGAGVRHVRINFRLSIGLGKPGGWHKDDLSVAIAHELQHAVEIAAWPEVVDGATMQAAYAKRGLDRGGTHLDTEAALRAGNDRRAELRGRLDTVTNSSAGDSGRAAYDLPCDVVSHRLARLRALDPLAAAAVESGLGRSPTFAALVQTIEGSQFVVYVETSRKLPGGMDGCLVHGGAAPRYLRVLLKIGLSVNERIEVLAHELQHVREVIDAGILNEPVAMDALFSRIGYAKRQPGGSQQEYETEAARLISAAVTRDLRAMRRHSSRVQ